MNISRIGFGVLFGIIFGVICYLVTDGNTFYSILTLLIVLGCIIYFDPRKRFGRWAQNLQWATIGYNLFTFTALLYSEELFVFFKSGDQTKLNVISGVIIIVLYILDYLNRKDSDKKSNWSFSLWNNILRTA